MAKSKTQKIDSDASSGASPSAIAVVTGQVTPRIDGPLKVSGLATYTSDFHFDGMAYAVPVGAKIGKGKIKTLDDSSARKMKGVLEVFTKKNIGPLYRPAPDDGMSSRIDEARPPFEDDVIRYYGQYVALVVAETFELAQAAARSIKVTYVSEKPNVSLKLEREDMKKVDTQRGDAAATFKKAPVQVDETYATPAEVHNPIEMHATVARWEKDDSGQDRVTLFETSQAILVHQNVLAQVLGLPRENVRVISKFLGSGFGGKLWAWPHSALAAASSRILKRPVKLVVDRPMMFMNVGHRPRTQQRIQIGADSKGRLQSLRHEYASQTSMLEDYKENCGEVSGFLYSCPNVMVESGVARRNQGVPTSMRGPGAVPGLFALESAMDELAVKLKLDPVELRLLNDTLVDESNGNPFSSRHLKECLELGSQKFGWSKRNPEVGSMRSGDEILGWGVSACTWAARRLDADASVEFLQTGRVQVNCATQDIGTGTYTVLAQIVVEETGLPFEVIDVALGDTRLPAGPLSGGSMATASVIPAVSQATKEAIKRIISGAVKTPGSPFFGDKPDQLKFEKGRVIGPKNKSGIEFAKLLTQLNMGIVSGHGTSKGTMGEKGAKFSTKSFGAQFVEIGWQPDIARLRVKRVVTVIDGGRIMNFQPAKNQVEGAVVMGIGMGLFEEAVYDSRDGFPVNSNLADYVMTVHADCPDIDVTFLDYPDKEVNAYGARGVGEIGLAGVASSLCAAVYHATGVRVRELPIQIEKLLGNTAPA